jgi:hypothetical protein
MDFHEDLKLPQETIDQVEKDAKNRKSDEFGLRQVELFHNADGHVYCLLEAAYAAAVRSRHAALGIACGDVHEVSGLL